MTVKYPIPYINTMLERRDVPGLLNALNEETDPISRHRIIDDLGHLRDKRASDTLLKLLSEEGDDVARERAIFALGNLKEKCAWKPILEILGNLEEPDEVRWAAADAISQFNDPRAIKPLLATLKNARGQVLTGVIHSLWRLKDRRAVVPLIHLFESIIASDAMRDLQGIGEGAWCNLMNVSRAFGAINDQRPIPALIRGLRIETQHPRCFEFEKIALETLDTLGFLRRPDASQILVDLLKNAKTVYFRRNLIPYLENVGDKAAVAGLAYVLDYLEDVKVDAGTALNRLKSEKKLLICDRCNLLRDELRGIGEITHKYFKICEPCWKELEPLQTNPDTRTVISCGWTRKGGRKRSGKRSK